MSQEKPLTKFYVCKARGCGKKVTPKYLREHWELMHFNLMYDIIEYSTQTVFELNKTTGEVTRSEPKTKDEIDKEHGFRV